MDRLAEKGLTPIATLYHWDLPLALHGRGGWRVRETAHAFAEYAEATAALNRATARLRAAGVTV